MLRRNNISRLILLVLVLIFTLNIKGQTGSNKYYYAYFYELKDSSKQYTELIHISNLLSRKFKYYYIISKEFGLDIRFIMPLESKYVDMKYQLEHPNSFKSDSVNQNSLTNCFEDILDPFVIEIQEPKMESSFLLKNDSMHINSILLKTNQSFKKDENYQYSVFFSHDSPSPKKVQLKGYFNKGRLEIINGFFFFDNIKRIIKDSIILESKNSSFTTNLNLYLSLLTFRDIEYKLKNNSELAEIYFPQYGFNIRLEQTNIAAKINSLISGGNIYETLMKPFFNSTIKDNQYKIKVISKKYNQNAVLDSNNFSLQIIGNRFKIATKNNEEDINTDTQCFYKYQNRLYYQNNISNQDTMLIIDFSQNGGTNTNFIGIFDKIDNEKLENVKSYQLNDTTIQGINCIKLLFKYSNNSGNFKDYLLLEKDTLIPFYCIGEFGYNDKKRSSVEYILR